MNSLGKQKSDQIEEKFERTAFTLTQERSDFLLPQIIDFVAAKKWMNLRPEYQRRLVWSVEKRSAFIESLLLNIPIPTLFLYERELGRYEVMDGQQRINAVVDFYAGAYALKGLEKWPEINGLKFGDLPEILQRGLDRRRLSATVVVADTAKPRPMSTVFQGDDVRKIVFERLNTGGQHLNAQELRNCLYAGPFNDMLIRLASTKQFRTTWDISVHPKHGSRLTIDEDEFYARLNENQLYSRMLDCEIVLRFFAFSDPKRLRGSVRSILDKCMADNLSMADDDIPELEKRFNRALKLARDIFGAETFRYRDPKNKTRLSRPLFDAVMIALDHLCDQRSTLLKKRSAVVAAVTKLLRREKAFAVIVGRPNTSKAIQARIDLLQRAISAAIP